jgi:hypothetical protein
MVKEEAMSQIAFDYFIHSELPFDSETPASIGAKFIDTLEALTRIDPTVFTNWEVTDIPAMASQPLATARSRIADIVENNVSRDDLSEPDPDYGGYSAVAFSDKVVASRRIHLRIHTGGKSERTTWLENRRMERPSRSRHRDLSDLQGRASHDQRNLASALGLRMCL